LIFGSGVESGEDIIQDDELLLGINGTGEGDSLFLAAA
jgi:hypothetical protein